MTALRPNIGTLITQLNFYYCRLGYVSAYAAVAMVNGEFSAEEGAVLTVPGFEGLTVEASDDGGLILFLNKLNKFDNSTVDQWIDIL